MPAPRRPRRFHVRVAPDVRDFTQKDLLGKPRLRLPADERTQTRVDASTFARVTPGMTTCALGRATENTDATYASSLLLPASGQSQCLPVHVFVDANETVREPRIPKISILFGTRWAS